MKEFEKVKIPSEVMARQVGDETVILDLASGTYFGLDPIGARIWQLISDGRTVAEICNTMLDEYDVERETLEHDLFDLLQALATQGLVERT